MVLADKRVIAAEAVKLSTIAGDEVDLAEEDVSIAQEELVQADENLANA